MLYFYIMCLQFGTTKSLFRISLNKVIQRKQWRHYPLLQMAVFRHLCGCEPATCLYDVLE